MGSIKAAAFSLFKKDTKVDNEPIVKAELKLVDNADSIPEIRICKRGVTMNDTEGDDWGLGLDEEKEKQDNNKKANDSNLQISITLKRIHTVVPSPEEGLIVLNILTDDGQNTKVWAKFGLESKEQSAMNMFAHHLQVLLIWVRKAL